MADLRTRVRFPPPPPINNPMQQCMGFFIGRTTRVVRFMRSGFDKLPGAIWSAKGARRVAYMVVRKTFPPQGKVSHNPA
ncbi:hypothetical protein QWZ13_17735 [Reinekea marina]|uniref:hypothetical protein n=1 Tax=Reinekea marina TaxID=1310421 RepID=UPI0025B3FAE6|nr:hypothetical protein [Reinekea marina]MDN3650752.1 hypothetical protein [Reinekea marina]